MDKIITHMFFRFLANFLQATLDVLAPSTATKIRDGLAFTSCSSADRSKGSMSRLEVILSLCSLWHLLRAVKRLDPGARYGWCTLEHIIHITVVHYSHWNSELATMQASGNIWKVLMPAVRGGVMARDGLMKDLNTGWAHYGWCGRSVSGWDVDLLHHRVIYNATLYSLKISKSQKTNPRSLTCVPDSPSASAVYICQGIESHD